MKRQLPNIFMMAIPPLSTCLFPNFRICKQALPREGRIWEGGKDWERTKGCILSSKFLPPCFTFHPSCQYLDLCRSQMILQSQITDYQKWKACLKIDHEEALQPILMGKKFVAGCFHAKPSSISITVQHICWLVKYWCFELFCCMHKWVV